MTPQDLVTRNVRLVSLPEVCIQVQALADSAMTTAEDIGEVVGKDTALTTRLLKLVNSAYFNLGVPVDNVRQAVHLMGMKPVHDLVLATALTSTFSQTDNKVLDMRAFWVESVRCAVYARLVAGCCNVTDRERLFVAGLLSHIGHQVMYLRLSGQTREASRKALATGVALADVESEMLGFSYADVGGELMRTWDLPDSLTEAVRDHVEPDSSARFAMDTAIVHIADALSRMHEQEVDCNLLLSDIASVAWRITGLTPEELLPLRDRAVEELDEAIGMLLSGEAAA